MSKKHRETRQRTETLATLLMPVFEEKLEESLGNRLRELRRQHGLSLRSLAEKSGLSANTLSLIENGKTSPSVATLQQIALALNVTITAFFETETHDEPVIHTRASERPSKSFAHGVIQELGSGIGEEGLQPLVVVFEPSSSSGPQPLTHDGTEFIMCLSGKIVYNVVGKEYILEAGDTLLFTSGMPHAWQNNEAEPARILLILSSIQDHKTNHKPQATSSRWPV